MTFRKGYVALLTVLVLSALSALVVSGLLLRSTGEARIISVNERSHHAHSAATACAEYALQRLKDQPNYAGNVTLNVGSATCYIYPPGGSGSTNRTVQTSSTVESVTSKIDIIVTKLNPVTISSWRDVVSF